ncbi:MAG: hypothetical protein OHK0023_09780 [Anaerolineae bacterium]
MSVSAKLRNSRHAARSYIRLALAAMVVTFMMITIGAITRVTESGYGCGPYWPSCNGHIIPEFIDSTVVIEYAHRIFALVVGVFSISLGVNAWRNYRHQPRLFYPAIAGVILFFLQSAIGALTVVIYTHSYHWVSVMIHLGNSMFLLAAYVVAWVNARALLLEHPAQPQARMYLPPGQLLTASTLTFLVAMVGAAVAGQDAARACIGWPLCGGEILPVEQGPLQMVNMLHRLVVGLLGILLILMIIQTRQGVSKAMRNAVWLAFGLYLAQATVGAFMVLVDIEQLNWLVTAKALHVLFAAATWAAMISASTIAWLQRIPNLEKIQAQAQAVAVSSETTSS